MPGWAAYLVAFLASGCALVLEVLAGRLLAPFIGVSLYTWTGVIGVVLAGLAAGNYLGGELAERRPGSRTLALTLFASGLATWLVPLAARVAGLPPLASLPPGWRIVLGATAGFLLPSLLLGAVTPQVVRLRLASLENAGGLVGRVYACATIGSIAGTLLTGFTLMAWFGVRSIVLGVGALLLGLGALVLLAGDPRIASAASAQPGGPRQQPGPRRG